MVLKENGKSLVIKNKTKMNLIKENKIWIV